MPPTPLPQVTAEQPIAENRRRHRRVRVSAVASLRGSEGARRVWIVHNLSLGGASIGSGPPLLPGQEVTLTLHVAGRPPFAVDARVLRRQVAASTGRCALSFRSLTAEQTAAITAALEAERTPDPGATVLISARPSRGVTTLVAKLEALGQRPRVVATPLEAAAWLQRDTEVSALLVEEKLLEVDGFCLPRFVLDTRPTLRRIAIAGDVESFRLNMALRSGLIDFAVERPFASAGLATKLGLEEPPPRRRPRRARG